MKKLISIYKKLVVALYKRAFRCVEFSGVVYKIENKETVILVKNHGEMTDYIRIHCDKFEPGTYVDILIRKTE